MLRFYQLVHILCWDLSWGMWEAVRVHDSNNSNSNNDGDEDDGIPKMRLVNYDGNGKDDTTNNPTYIPFPVFCHNRGRQDIVV